MGLEIIEYVEMLPFEAAAPGVYVKAYPLLTGAAMPSRLSTKSAAVEDGVVERNDLSKWRDIPRLEKR